MKYLNKLKRITYYFLLASVIAMAFFSWPINYILAQNNIIIENIQTENIDGKTEKIIWQTNIESQGKIILGKDKDYFPYYIIDTNKPTKYHEVIIGNLDPETTYYFQIIDINNSQSNSSFTQNFKTIVYHDETPPQISDLKIAYVSGTKAAITWTTNEKASAKIEYGPNLNYGKLAAQNSLDIKHQIILSNLNLDTIYFLKIYSEDKDKNKSGYYSKSFTTLASDKIDKENLIISYLRPLSLNDPQITENSITITFKTNHYAKGNITLTSNKVRKTINLDYNTNHKAVFEGLAANREHYFTISMDDIFNKRAKIDNQKINTAKITGIINNYKTINANNDIIVEGIEFSLYTPASRLYKTAESAKIYAIINGERRYIPSPSLFNEYGYRWPDVKVISWVKLSRYPEVKLVKSPDSPVIYYLYKKPENKIIKINLPSPAVFNSYPNNKWEKVVTISQKDLNAYQDAQLIKALNDPAVYYLENNMKKFVSEAVFNKHNFNFFDVAEINQTHLNAYQTGSPLE